MTPKQAANLLLNANYRPDQILKALKEMEKAALAAATQPKNPTAK